MNFELLKWILFLLAALAVLVKAADYFTDASEKLGKIFGVPQFIIGVTVIALGTSMPELAASIVAVSTQNSAIVAGNVIGSNIANLLLVGGFAAMISGTMIVNKPLIRVELPILIAITGLLVVTIADGKFEFAEGIILIVGYLIYVAYNYHEHKNNKAEQLSEGVKKAVHPKEKMSPKLALILLFSIAGISVGAHFTIKALTEVASIANIAPSIIAVSAVAIGTSLPELLVSYKAAKKKNYELVIGNIIGSNIFNATLVMGIPALIGTLTVEKDILTIAVPFLVLSTILFAFSGIERRFYSFEGALYGLIYIVFIGQLFSII